VSVVIYYRLIKALNPDSSRTLGVEVIPFTLFPLLIATMPAVNTVNPPVVIPLVLGYGKAGNPIHPRGIIRFVPVIPTSYSKV